MSGPSGFRIWSVMANNADLRIAAIAAVQEGTFTEEQARQAGINRAMAWRRVQAEFWEQRWPGVFRFPAAPRTWEQAVITAVFASGPGAAASHGTAAYLWDLTPSRPNRIEIVVPRGIRRIRPWTIHQSTDLDDGHVTLLKSIMVTNPTRTLIDMGIPWRETVTGRALDEALRRELTGLKETAALLHLVARRGRNGVGVFRRLLIERLGWNGITQSQLEDEFRRILSAAGVPLPTPQVQMIKKGGPLIARTDFAYVDESLVIELDSERCHLSRDAFRNDRRRQNELVLEGWTVLRFTTWDVFAAPEFVITQVVQALIRPHAISRN